MPVIFAAEESTKRARRLVQLVFPRLLSPDAPEVERWEWPELRAGISPIQGFGLYPRAGGGIVWEKLERPVMLPYLGKETEVESASQARVLRGVLSGCFDLCRCKELRTPAGHCWVQDGTYVTLRSSREARKERDTIIGPDERLIQVAVTPDYDDRGVHQLCEGDEEVCYMRADEAAELLHLPKHVFDLLAAHAEDEHADRNFSTHVVQFTRRAKEHLLVNAHPLFRNSAFIMGNANEPVRGPPTLELVERTLTPLENDDPLMVRAGLHQPEGVRALFDAFKYEFPEVTEKSMFFLTKRDSYPLHEELSVVYGSSYNRTYSTWGHPGRPLAYKIPSDIWEDGTWSTAADGTPAWAQWPKQVPGWYNVDAQPRNRPTFRRAADGSIELVHDLRCVVKARRQGLDGGREEQRLAKLNALFINWSLPELPLQPFALRLSYRLAIALPVYERREWTGGPLATAEREVVSRREMYNPGPLMPPLPTNLFGRFATFCPFSSKNGAGQGGSQPEDSTSRIAEPSVACVPAGSGSVAAPDDLALALERVLEPVSQFELARELRTLSVADLRAEAAIEEATLGDAAGTRLYDNEDEEPEWDAPWRQALGSVVWARIDPFPYWPAVVEMPAVLDRDIARLRDSGSVFVRFLGWNEKRGHSWVHNQNILWWEDGLAIGLHQKHISKASHRKLFALGKRMAAAEVESRPRVPLNPPPWWLLHAVRGKQASATPEDWGIDLGKGKRPIEMDESIAEVAEKWFTFVKDRVDYISARRTERPTEPASAFATTALGSEIGQHKVIASGVDEPARKRAKLNGAGKVAKAPSEKTHLYPTRHAAPMSRQTTLQFASKKVVKPVLNDKH